MRSYLAHAFNIFLKIFRSVIILLAAVFLFIIITVAVAYRDLKSAADNGLNGKALLTEAAAEIQNKNWSLGLEKARAAQDKFSAALASTDKIKNKALFSRLAPLNTQINDLEYLLKTAEIISRSLIRSIPLVEELDKIRSGATGGDFANLPAAEKERFLKLIYESEPELNGLKANLNLAILNLDKIHKIGILWPVYKQISDVKQELIKAEALLGKMVPLAKLLPALAGYPENSRFLLIMQNNDELRPTGGFIGVDGILEVKEGEILSLKTDDSYHLDMPAVGKWQMVPPAPIKKYLKVENWYLRDANWSPDWPTGARKIEEIYRGESAAIGQAIPPFTGIIALNPDLVADLLRLVGPITVRGENYTADNFQPLLQYNVEVAYKEQNISSWNRKEIINELLSELKKRLFSLPSERWSELLKITDRNISQKNIQVYFNNPAWEDLAGDLKASGEVVKQNQDYLLVVDANLAAFKTDVVVKKNIDYTVEEKNNQLQASLKLNYRHEGGFDWRTTRYRTYTRIYAPLGSKLISLSGLNESQADLTTTDDTDLNKTVFGFFLSVEPGSSQEISLIYSLPASLDSSLSNGSYQLLVQKQSGRRTENLKVRLINQGKNLKNWQTDLETDKNFFLISNGL